jgi:hypothetical protein
MRPGVTLAAVVSLMGWVAPSLDAQQSACPPQSVLVSVVNRKGELVRDLKPKDFHGTFRGQPVQIRAATWTARPPRVVVAFDTSGSMSRPGMAWGLARYFATVFFSSAPPESSLALITFGESVRQVDAVHEIVARGSFLQHNSCQGGGITPMAR